MLRKFREWISVQLVKNPGSMVLVAILLFNIAFLLISAGVISALSLDGTEKMGFIEAAFCTVTMILDAGCIQFVIADIGQAGVVISVVCLGIVLIGMISFTGAVIGYITNYISHFIENANAGSKKLNISGHVAILNWNTRASEIINDLLYCEEKQNVVVLVGSRKKEIEKEIDERLSDTVRRENAAIAEQYKDLSFFRRVALQRRERFRRNITVIVREGDVFSSKQLADISLEHARAVIILGNDVTNSVCRFEHMERLLDHSRGNSQTVKTLMQVADITSAESSDSNQKIIVEITDDWTWDLVDRIIKYKQVDEKCNIVPVRVNRVLGEILAQFSLMPELNMVYRELFSNKGAAFWSVEQKKEDDETFISGYLPTHRHALPLTMMDYKNNSYCYYAAASVKDIMRESKPLATDGYSVSLNRNYWLERKNVVILGHNSKIKDIMLAFCNFESEWNHNGEHILNLIVIDDEKSLERMNYYKDYPFVAKTVAADIYDNELICHNIEEFVSANEEDTSILILSDDEAPSENIDASSLANLVYVQDIINRKLEENPDFDEESIDIIVEIIDPKHHDIVNSYSVNNVVISNRYISKMVTQISEKEALFDFYTDILTYDEEGESGIYDSKEIYIKKVSRLFTEIPGKCTADQLVRAVYEKSLEDNNPTIVLGYVKPGGRIVLFCGDRSAIDVELEPCDKLVVFTSH